MKTPRNQTLVHRFTTFFRWRGKKFATNLEGRMMLTSAVVDAGFSGIRWFDHRRRASLSAGLGGSKKTANKI